MNTLDIIILIVISLMTFYGVWKGFVKQVMSILGILVGYVVATKYYAQFATVLKFNDPNIAKIVGFIILFLACVILFTVLALVLNRIFKLPGLGVINSFFGGVIGFFKGFLLVAISVIVLIALLSSENPILSRSITVPYILRGLMAAESAIPRDIKVQYHKKIDGLIKEVSQPPAAATTPATAPAQQQKKK
jgi:membrane protein required for colicin V production